MLVTPGLLVATIGVLVTLLIFLGTVVYKAGGKFEKLTGAVDLFRAEVLGNRALDQEHSRSEHARIDADVARHEKRIENIEREWGRTPHLGHP